MTQPNISNLSGAGENKTQAPGIIRRTFNKITPSKTTAVYWFLLALAAAGVGATVFYWPAALAVATTALTAVAALTISGVAPFAFLAGLSALMTAVAATAVIVAAGLALWMGVKLAKGAFNMVRGNHDQTLSGDNAPLLRDAGDDNDLTDDETPTNAASNNDSNDPALPEAPYQGAAAGKLFASAPASASDSTNSPEAPSFF